jgi:hypothetical protein
MHQTSFALGTFTFGACFQNFRTQWVAVQDPGEHAQRLAWLAWEKQSAAGGAWRSACGDHTEARLERVELAPEGSPVLAADAGQSGGQSPGS